jgi:hypothetical protein
MQAMARLHSKELVKDAFGQWRALRGILLSAWAPALLGIAGLICVSVGADIPISKFTRDPSAVMNGPSYAGALSNLGALMWSATAAVCLFCASLLRGKVGRVHARRFLLASAGFTGLLLVDDLFMLHDLVLPEYFSLRERYVVLSYGVLMLSYLVVFRDTILRTEWLVLVFAGGFFFLSLAVDKLPEDLLPMHHIFEDGAKFMGIVTCLLYMARTSRALIKDPSNEL